MANNIYTYQKNVATSGTPVQLADQGVEQDQIVLLKAKSANTGTISIGYDSASANNGSISHFKLIAGQSIEVEVANTKQIWIDSTVNGEGVEYIIGASAGGLNNTDNKGNTKVSVQAAFGSGYNPLNMAGNIGDGNNGSGIVAISPQVFNGNTYDYLRSNSEIIILASGARTTTQTGADKTNYNGKGVYVVLDVTGAGTGSITLTIEGKDVVSGKYYTLLAGTAVTTISTNIYKIYPGLTAVANAVTNDILPRTFRVTVTANNANSITYSVGAVIIL